MPNRDNVNLKTLTSVMILPLVICCIAGSALVGIGNFAWAQHGLANVVITTSSLTEREAALHVAKDRGFFAKQSVDATLVQVRSGPLAIAALTTGESQLHWGSVTSANLGAIAAGADLVFVAGFINRLSGTLVSHPRINMPGDLRGSSIGVNTSAGGGGAFTTLALEHWGLNAERDKILFRSLGDQSVLAQALVNGTVDAAYFGYTYGAIMQDKGFRLLADFEKLPIRFQGSGVIAQRSFVKAASKVVDNVLRALKEAVTFIRNPLNKAAVLQSMARGTQLPRIEDAEVGYRRVLALYEAKMVPSVDGLRNAIRVLGMQNEKIRGLNAENLVLDHLARKIDAQQKTR